ncbi:YcjF family protein [Orrella marina]|uniref:GTPase n=1 Tax=Orrella marina TaxID=2163011 RepID=A0A2R4XIT5_9BURK|nr:DUF533 domain-containing protein [Orrella marina]AWB33726.1 GTPase [Orrella marina]
MTPERAILSIVMFAAFADGAKDDREREHIREFAQQLGQDVPDLSAAYQDVLMSRVTLHDVAHALTDHRQKQYAYELAVCVCESDSTICEAERTFLRDLSEQLGLSAHARQTPQIEAADSIALAAQQALAEPAVEQVPQHAESVRPASLKINHAQIDSMVLKYAILNGALELLPQSWASVAIIPLQIKMVYRIGKQAGYDLDQGHIRELLATVGVGLTSQYVEQFGRKLLGGLLGSFMGKTGRKVGRSAASVAMSFATTYALGQLAKRYYGEGRQMSTDLLKRTFSDLMGPAKSMQQQYLPQIQEKAATLDAQQVLSMVRSNSI